MKNQYRGLDDEEAEFLDSVLEATRKKEEEIRRETREGVDAFRKLQVEVEKKALGGEDEEGEEGVKKEEVQWVGHGKKRKKGPELLKGVKLRRVGEVQDEKKEEGRHREETQRTELATEVGSGTFLYGESDLLHAVGAVMGREHLATEDESHHQSDQRDHPDNGHQRQVAPRQRDFGDFQGNWKYGHATSS